MKISFHGAAGTVTGSKHLIHLKNGKNILLDCGMFQGGGQETETLNRHFGFIPLEVDALVLSHAHIDHSGLIPKLVKDGFNGKIFCTPATYSLAEALLKDSAKIQEEDVNYLNKRRKAQNKKPLEPLYTSADAENALNYFHVRPLNESFEVIENVSCVFTEAGHILGSGVVNLSIKEDEKKTQICFTGDVGRYNDPILNSPASFPQADVIICESTYGDSLHDDLAISEDILLKEIMNTCVHKKGKLIIPSFSLGRTQEIVYALNRLDISKKLPNLKYYVDSPLSYLTTEITKKHKECYNKELLEYMKTDSDPFGFENLTYITDVEDSIALNSNDAPCVILSASGMADAGRVKHHIANSIEDSKNTILIVGYCEPSSLGARLQNESDEVKIFGKIFKKNAEVNKIKSFSAHADYMDLMQFLSGQDPKKVDKFFIVHGEPKVQENFKNKLIKKGFDFVEIPQIHESFNI
jgi:metallo-beta-lactamase family protein